MYANTNTITDLDFERALAPMRVRADVDIVACPNPNCSDLVQYGDARPYHPALGTYTCAPGVEGRFTFAYAFEPDDGRDDDVRSIIAYRMSQRRELESTYVARNRAYGEWV